jgi:hypothetical protein
MAKDLKIKDSARYLKQRVLTTKLYYTNKLEELRLKAIENGALPYKIIQYKRVVAPEKTPIPLAKGGYIHPDNFDKQLKYIAKHCKPITLDSLTELIENNHPIPDKAVVVTLDGGHMDNYIYAFPKLLQYKIPATFFLSTGYIESDLFFYSDRLVLCLMSIKQAKKCLPLLDFLAPEIQEELNTISPNGEITEELVNYLTFKMAVASQEDRIMLMEAFANLDRDIPAIPVYEDFMRWDDIRHMQSLGFSFGTMGHFAVADPEIDRDSYLDDLSFSIKTLQDNEIKPSPVVCLPYIAPTSEVIDSLNFLGCRFALTNLFFPEPRLQTQLPMLLSKTAISQINSHSIDFFACSLWDIDLKDSDDK